MSTKISDKKYAQKPKPAFSVFTVFKYLLIFLLRLIAVRSKPYKPSLQEKVMGEKVSFSRKYYIPDDKI